jgi:hypothetical protein
MFRPEVELGTIFQIIIVIGHIRRVYFVCGTHWISAFFVWLLGQFDVVFVASVGLGGQLLGWAGPQLAAGLESGAVDAHYLEEAVKT